MRLEVGLAFEVPSAVRLRLPLSVMVTPSPTVASVSWAPVAVMSVVLTLAMPAPDPTAISDLASMFETAVSETAPAVTDVPLPT